MSIFSKRAQDLTVGESLGLSLGIMILSCLPFAIAAIAEGDCLNLKKEEQEPPKEIEIEEEETSE